MWLWDKNLAYIKTNEHLIDKEVYRIISNEKWYSPEYRESLHDCRLVKMEVCNGEIQDFLSKKEPERTITLTLLGAYHDLYHIVRYKKVKSYSVTENFEPSDLIEHYFSLAGEFITHTMLFHFGNITINFEKIKIETINM